MSGLVYKTILDFVLVVNNLEKIGRLLKPCFNHPASNNLTSILKP